MDNIILTDANNNETYFSIHNINKAHEKTKGEEIKVGIIDWQFSYDENFDIYYKAVNITKNEWTIKEKGHGFLMARTLKEIAPNCNIIAINGVSYDSEEIRLEFLEKSIEWAIENKIDILTYSHPRFSKKFNDRIYNIMEKAYRKGIISTFIHNDSIYNLWPYACFPFSCDADFQRNPDINIYHFDYSHLYLNVYNNYIKKTKNKVPINSGNDIPFFSFSSMSVVAGGFVALLKSVDLNLTLEKCKKVLRQTSYGIVTSKENEWYKLNTCDNIVDINKAIDLLAKQVEKSDNY